MYADYQHKKKELKQLLESSFLVQMNNYIIPQKQKNNNLEVTT